MEAILYVSYQIDSFLGVGVAVGLIIGQHLILEHDVYYNCYTVLALNQLFIQYTYRQASINIRINVGQHQKWGQGRGGAKAKFFFITFLSES